MLVHLLVVLVAGGLLLVSPFLFRDYSAYWLLVAVSGSIGLWAAIRLFRAVALLRRARAAGWAVAWLPWVLHSEDALRFDTGSTPRREDYAVLPSWIEEASEIENLIVAMRIIGGVDHQDWSEQRRVTIYESDRPAMVDYIAGVLQDEGIRVELDTGATAGVFGSPLSQAVLVRASEEETARRLLQRLLDGESQPASDEAPPGEAD